MKKLSILFFVFALFSCKDLMVKHQQYQDEQNRGKFSVNLASPQIRIGETEVQFDSPFPFAPLRNSSVIIFYYPQEDAVCLQYRIDTYTYHQFWSRESRRGFLEGLEAYNRDFDGQNLRRSRRTTGDLYGTVHGYLYWQMSRFTMQAYGNNLMDIGYFFKKKTPFFTITVGNAVHINYGANSTRERNVNSGERPMYFTKAQATKIAECFDQQYLQSIVPSTFTNTQTTELTESWMSDSDVFDEYD